jgi:peptidylprolyl isomerase
MYLLKECLFADPFNRKIKNGEIKMSKSSTQEKKTDTSKEGEGTAVRNRNYLMIMLGGIILVIIAAGAMFVLTDQGVVMKGDNVSFYYTLMYENGTVISSHMNGTPAELTVGSSDIISGFSNAVMGMKVNEKKTLVIPYDQAYGPYKSELVRVVNRTGMIANMTFVAGQYFTIHRNTDNATSVVRILDVTPSTVTWDENNPLAGQNLTFTVQIVHLNRSASGNVAGTLTGTKNTTPGPETITIE